jgi:type IV pilus assembly protein PilB
MAQRLIRLVCPKCREPDQPPAAEIKSAGLTPQQVKEANFQRGRGCAHCNYTGYRGRKGIFEMLRMNSSIREMTFNREPTQSIRRQARLLGMRTLLEDAIAKAVAGITTLEEVLSTCHHETHGG